MPAATPAQDSFEPALERLLATMLMQGLDATHVGVCLCDGRDRIRFVNEAFRAAFFPNAVEPAGDFTAAIAAAITAGCGVRLETMPLAVFVPRVREQRRTRSAAHDFSVDLADGRWWRVCDRKLPNGWTLTVATDVTTLKREELDLRHAHAAAVEASRTDHLTGLPNRRCGIERTAAAVDECRKGGEPLSVAFLDIDRFKGINDRHGHAAGDAVLVAFADMLKSVIGAIPNAFASRMGGEEFLLVMPRTTVDGAEEALGRMIRGLEPVRWLADTPALSYTVSAGVAEATGGDGVNELLLRADAALYRAKAGGRDRVER